MPVETIRWKKGRLELIDQRILPARKKYIACNTAREVEEAIKNMTVRGAPAIGVTAAYGVYLGVRGSRARSFDTFVAAVERVSERIARTRPTARNLFWALERMKGRVLSARRSTVPEIKDIMLKEAGKILEQDRRICRKIGAYGSRLVGKGATVLTHCNAGALATADYGTALGVIYASAKKIRMVYVDETRPVLQGARLTAWELTEEGIPATLICDDMAAYVMARRGVDAVIVGADRIAANGDTANKIGTYNLAILARYHKIPFYVAAPVSTFDLSVNDGRSIPIEERSETEVREIAGRRLTHPGIKVYNPAFDVTPRELITAIITEKGVIYRPSRKKIRALNAGMGSRKSSGRR